MVNDQIMLLNRFSQFLIVFFARDQLDADSSLHNSDIPVRPL